MTGDLAALAGASPARYTEIRYEQRHRTVITVQGREPEQVLHGPSGLGVVRCLSEGGCWGLATFQVPAEAERALRRALDQAALGGRGRTLELAPVPPRQAAAPLPPGGGALPPLATKCDLARLAGDRLLGADRRIIHGRVRYEDELADIRLWTSEGTALSEGRAHAAIDVLAVAGEEGTTERAVGGLRLGSGRAWDELMAFAGSVAEVSGRAVARLHATPLKAGRYPVVLDPRFAGTLAHRTIGHRCHGDAGPGGPAPLPLGTRLGPEQISIGDDGTALGLGGTFAFDHEGVAPRNTVLVRHGVMVAHVHTRASAAEAGVAPTGNARADRDGFPVARLSNTYIANGRGNLDTLLAPIRVGVYLAEPEISIQAGRPAWIGAGSAWMVRDGALAEPVKGAGLAGDGLALFGLVDGVAGDFRWDPAPARCERDGAVVPVSLGAPHLRLIETAVGGPS